MFFKITASVVLLITGQLFNPITVLISKFTKLSMEASEVKINKEYGAIIPSSIFENLFASPR